MKRAYRIVIGIIFGVAVLYPTIHPTIYAATESSNTSTPALSGTAAVILNSAFQTASTTYPGQTNTFRADLSATTASTSALVDLELRNQNGQSIVQHAWDNVVFDQQNILRYGIESPPNLPPGVYTWKVGLFTPGWKEQIKWYDNPLSFAVVGTSTISMGTTSPTLLGGTWQRASTLYEGQSNYLSAEFIGGDRTGPALLEIDLFDSNNRLVTQKEWDYVTVQLRQVATKSVTTPTLSAGTYHWSIGIFAPERKALYTWYDSVQTFTVGSSTNL